MVDFVVGGKAIAVDMMNLKAIRTYTRRAPEMIEAQAMVAAGQDPAPETVDAGLDAILAVLSNCLEGTPDAASPEQLQLRIKGMAEAQGLAASFAQLLRDSGLVIDSAGEAGPAGLETQTLTA